MKLTWPSLAAIMLLGFVVIGVSLYRTQQGLMPEEGPALPPNSSSLAVKESTGASVTHSSAQVFTTSPLSLQSGEALSSQDDSTRSSGASSVNRISPAAEATPSALTSDMAGLSEQLLDEAPQLPSQIPGVFAIAKMATNSEIDQERLTDIADAFSERMKSAGWDTSTDAYHKAWKEATQDAEESLKASIGVQAFQELKARQAQED